MKFISFSSVIVAISSSLLMFILGSLTERGRSGRPVRLNAVSDWRDATEKCLVDFRTLRVIGVVVVTPSHPLRKANPVWIRTRNPDRDDFQNLLEFLLSKDSSMIQKIGSAFQRYQSNCGKMPYLAIGRILKNSSIRIPEAYDLIPKLN